LGYGRPTSRAILGETLTVTVPVNVDSVNDIANECVAADVYFGEDKLAGEDVTTVLLPGAGSERVIKVTTRKFVNEPVVTLYVAAGCNAKVSRKFVAFADPPNVATPSQSLNQAEAPAPVAYAAKAGSVRVGGLTVETSGSTIAPSADEGQGVPRSASRFRKSGNSSSAQATAKAPKPSASEVLQGAPSLALSARSQAQAARVADDASLGKRRGVAAGKSAISEAPRSTGERLMLDPVDADAVIQPNLTMTAALQGKVEGDDPSPEVRDRRAAAAALWLALNATPEQLARDQLRVQELEKRLAALKQESAQAQQQIAQLRTRVQEAESAQSSPTLVYALGGLAALLAAAVAVLFLKDRRKSDGSDWWKADAASPAAEPVDDDKPDTSSLESTLATFKPGPGLDDGSRDTTPVAAPVAPAPAVPREPAPTFNIPPVVNAPPAAPAVPPSGQAARAPRPALQDPPREVSVEELIDLEQQAEFFVVLGQDDAALDLLESHVQSTTGASPLPFLKLLEIYQRLGKRQDYERVQAEFNQRFNGYAPAWESDLLQGHSLSEYPGIVERLQSLWASPSKAMDVLERSLTRPDAEAETFDLPAYRELLFLYAVARDLSEREPDTREAVDLSLPFVDPTMVTVTSEPETIEPLMATRPVKAQPQAQPMISLDLSLDDLEPMEPLPSVSSVEPPAEAGNAIDFEHVDLNHDKPDKS
jgi:hypothetical protein